MHICITEYPQGERKCGLQAGQKIFHSKYGRGMVVGFNALMDEPVVFFYEPNSQVKFGKRVVIAPAEELQLISEKETKPVKKTAVINLKLDTAEAETKLDLLLEKAKKLEECMNNISSKVTD